MCLRSKLLEGPFGSQMMSSLDWSVGEATFSLSSGPDCPEP